MATATTQPRMDLRAQPGLREDCGMASRSAFFGRAHEVALIGELLAEHRIVTLVGPGGIGKTRLAVEAAAGLQDRYPGGVRVVELHGVTEQDDVGDVVARQLGLDSVDALRYRSSDDDDTLLVLDNCESALAPAAELAAKLLDEDPTVQILATSRAPLGTHGERVLPIGPLELPRDADPEGGTASAAVQLFLDRAARAGAALPQGEADDDIVHLVLRLDGMPLAIELAAARSRVLTPAQLLASLEDQLDLLRRPGGPTDRHRSIRATFNASYEPLRAELQAAFRRLCVLTEPFDLRLASGILADSSDAGLDPVDVLTDLVDTSLIDASTDEAGRIRFRVLEPLRRCGWDLLDEHHELEAAADRYVDAMVGIADTFLAAIGSAFTPDLVEDLSQRYVHLVKAVDWCLVLDRTAARANRLVLVLYSETRSETLRLTRRVLAAWPGPAPLGAEARAVMGAIAVFAGAADEVEDLLRAVLEDPSCSDAGRMIAYRAIGYTAAYRGDFVEGGRKLEIAATYAEHFSPSFARQMQLDRAATISDPAEAAAALAVVEGISLALADQNEPLLVHWAAMVAAHLHLRRGDADAALKAVTQADALGTQTGHPWSWRMNERTVSVVLAVRDGWVAAAPHFRAALDASLAQGDLADAATTLRAAAGASLRQGDEERARQLWAAVPHGHGRSIIPSFFAVEEHELERRFGTVPALDLRGTMRTARELLAPHTVAQEATLQPTSDGVIRFGDFEIDPVLFELRRKGERVHLEPQVFEVLRYLAERRGTLVTKNELLDEVWGNRFVSESALTSRIKAARKATGDDGQSQSVIRTVHGRGYTFVAEVG